MANKRTLKIESVPNSTLLQLKWDGGGELPDMLKGMYTSTMEAQIAIQRWEATKTPEMELALLKKDEEAKRAPAQK